MRISTLTYAIGDVHGRADLLRALLDFIKADATARRQPPRIFFLGDLVDRGPDSRGVFDLVAATLDRWPGSRLILGNHDDAFLDIMRSDAPDPEKVEIWLVNGGDVALAEYDPDGDLGRARALLHRDCPQHLALLETASILEVDGDYAFVHAGIDPARPTDDQDRRTCMYIRRPFLDHAGPLSHVVVHGHTITPTRLPTVAAHRLSIDTGAFATGRLTAAVLDPREDAPRFAMTAVGEDGAITVGYGGFATVK